MNALKENLSESQPHKHASTFHAAFEKANPLTKAFSGRGGHLGDSFLAGNKSFNSTDISFFKKTTSSLPAARKLAKSLNTSTVNIEPEQFDNSKRDIFVEKLQLIGNANLSHHAYNSDNFSYMDKDKPALKGVELSFPGLNSPPSKVVKPKSN